MKPLPKPKDANAQLLDSGEVYDICISKVRNAALKARLMSIRGQIVQGAADYDARAASCDLHQFGASSQVGSVSKKEMMKVYNKRFAAAKSPGRGIYLKIRKASPNDRCPLCEVGMVTTLDHYLPKSKYPLLSVIPHNLIPACMWCQTSRPSRPITSQGDLTFHPYFDDFDDEVWLMAEVVQSAPAVFKFGVSKPARWDDLKFERAKSHFKDFNMQVLLASNSANQLVGIRGRLGDLLTVGGANAVEDHLREEEVSWRASNKNSWEAAFYAAAASDAWFCSGGFNGV